MELIGGEDAHQMSQKKNVRRPVLCISFDNVAYSCIPCGILFNILVSYSKFLFFSFSSEDVKQFS